ncbi:hypothetical protein [Streptomyces sp. NPDC051211]|uniref:hypothetical protein n=1 Tax=Streptomyces sp. NPDC051211 TaxID=3154643 RepID=UPI00344FF0D0
MSNTFSIPVLRGRGATVLSSGQDGLVLERPGKKLTIPTRAIARVHAEARSVTVELRTLAGMTPSLYRIEDVSAAAAVAFADAVPTTFLLLRLWSTFRGGSRKGMSGAMLRTSVPGGTRRAYLPE